MIKKSYLFLTLLTALLLGGIGSVWGADETLTIYETNTTTNYYVPVYGSWLDADQHNQFIIPASELTDLQGGTIKGLKFHLSNLGSWSSSGSAQPTVVVSVAEVDETQLSALNTTATLHEVYSGSMNMANKAWTITFPSNKYYTYGNKNLLVDVVATAGGKYITTTWIGKAVTNAAYSYNGVRGFLPRTTFTYAPAPVACAKPSGLTKTAVSTTSATFTWTAGGTESSWQYICLPAASTVDWSDANVQVAASETATVNSLAPDTDYKFYLRAYCSETDQSANAELAFTTPCEAKSVPFGENFNDLTAGAGLIPDCWSKIAYSTYPNINGSQGVGGSKCLYFSGGTSTTSSIIVLPVLDAPTNTLAISFDYKNSYTNRGRAIIGFMTDPTDASTFQEIKPLERLTDWTPVEEELLTSAPANSYIAIQFAGGGSNSTLCIDNIEVAVPAACKKPGNVTVGATSPTSLKVAWTAKGEETAWNVRFSTDGVNWTTRPAATNPFVLDELSAGTTYEVQVQADCGGAQSNWTASKSAATLCAPVEGIGFSQNFNSESSTSGNIPSCWSKINSGNYPQVYNYYAKGNTGKCLEFYGGVSGVSEQIAILPPFSEATNTLFVSLYYSNSQEEYGGWYDYSTSDYGQLAIGYITDPTDASTFVAQETLARVKAYTQAQVALTNAPAGSYVALRYAGGSTSGEVYVDDIEISEIPSCLTPSGLAGNALSTTSAEISWSSTASKWNLRYSLKGEEAWTTVNDITQNPCTLSTGLAASKDYEIQIQTVCGEQETSDWGTSSYFSMPCDVVSMPFSQNFNSLSAAGQIPTCWDNAEGTTDNDYYKWSYNAYGHEGACVQFDSYNNYSLNDNYLKTPEIAVTETAILSFWYKNPAGGDFSVYYSLDGGTTKTELATGLTGKSAWTKHADIELPAACINQNVTIIFKGTSNYAYGDAYISLDDVMVMAKPSCVAPAAPVASSITSTSAVLTWTAGGEESAWLLQYSTDGQNWVDANEGNEINTNSFTLTNLASNHATYYAHVKAVCGVGDESIWSDASDAFYTECAKRSMPFSENFDALTEGIPTCWDNSEGTTTTPSYKWNSNANGHEGNGVQFDSYNNSTGKTNVLKTPTITISEPAILEFWYQNAAGGDLSVYYSIDGVQQAAALATGLTNQSSWKQVSVNLPAACVGHDVVIMFQGTSNYGYSNIYLDDIQIVEQPACPAVDATSLQESNVTAHTATVSWTAAGEETAWNLQYKAAGGEWSDAIAVNGTPSYNFANLAESTVYYVRVQADCAGDGTSEWTGDEAFSFPTDCDPKTVTKAQPWNYGFEDTEDGFVPACWDRNEPYANYGYPVVAEYSYYANTGSKYLYFKTPGRASGWDAYTEDAILPVFNTEIKNLKVSFVYFNNANTANYGQLAIGYIANNTFTQVGDLLAMVDDYTSVEREMPNDAPDGARIAIRCIGGNKGSSYTTYIYVDDVVVSLKPTCYTPTALAAAETSDGAVLTWTAGKDESEWSVRYSVKDADEWAVVSDEIAANNYTLTGLNSGTTYEAQVKAICGDNDESDWSASVEFTPACNAPSALAVTARTANSATFSWTSSESAFVLQYSADGVNWESENVTTNPFTLSNLAAGTTYQAKIQAACGSDFSNVVEFTTWCGLAEADELPINEDFSAGVKPACWQFISETEYPSVANNKIWFQGENEQIVVLPGFNIELNKLYVSFDYTTYNSNIELGYYAANSGTFQSLGAVTSGEEISLASIAPAAAGYLAIRYYDASGIVTTGSVDNVRVYRKITLADNVDNTATLAALNGKTVDVTIGRTIVCADYFNTICLPFDLPTLDGTPLEGGELWAFKYAKVENNELLFRIIESDHIEAGVPYFISFPAGDNIVSPLFKNVTISAAAGQEVGDDVAKLCGIIDQPVVFNAGDQTKLFLAANNTLYWWNGSANSQLNSFRAYFKVGTGAGAPARHGMPARIIKQEESATGFENVQSDAQTLKLIENGNVVIIRNGVKYNIQGQVISK